MDITGLDAALSTVSAYDIGSSTSPVTLQEEFGIEIPSEDLENIVTVNDIIGYLKEKGVEA